MHTKKHIAKSQIIINEQNNEIIHCYIDIKGAKYDLRVFKECEVKISKKIKLKADLGYQGIQKIHTKSKIPFKKPRKTTLPKNQRKYNTKLRQKRVKVEHVIRKCKLFRIVKEQYRNKQKNLQIVWSIICGIVNYKS